MRGHTNSSIYNCFYLQFINSPGIDLFTQYWHGHIDHFGVKKNIFQFLALRSLSLTTPQIIIVQKLIY
jgi:hypothetical protein